MMKDVPYVTKMLSFLAILLWEREHFVVRNVTVSIWLSRTRVKDIMEWMWNNERDMENT